MTSSAQQTVEHASDRTSGQRTDGWVLLRDYALLGDMGAAALVASDGAIDWFAAPAIDSPPLCAALLDPPHGGSISLSPSVPFRVTRRYRDDSLVLETTFSTDEGEVRVTDALDRGDSGRLPWTELARRVDAVAGAVPMTWSVRPGHRLGTDRPWCFERDGVAGIVAGDQQLAVVADRIGAPRIGPHGVHGEFVAEQGSCGLLAVVAAAAGPVFVPDSADVFDRIDRTAEDWRRWSERIETDVARRDLVVRSALTIKALTSDRTGAIAGAATTSLPEKLGGKRNFDYRYSWIRDSSFAVDAMSRLGLSEEVHGSVSWLVAAASQQVPDLRTFYALDGSVAGAQMSQVDAPGYRDSRPVHVGNAAASQTQLGCFGDLLDALWGHVQSGGQLDDSTAALVCAMADRTCQLWRQPDAGLWELGDQQHYTISKIGCWVALDRALRMADAGQLVSTHLDRWRAEREEIRHFVDAECWSQVKGAYTFYAGTDELDAAVLLAARTRFCEPDDARLASTIDAIRAELTADGPLLFRYSGQRGAEGTFTACSCWLVEALAYVGRLEEATELFDGVAARANDVGLYSEEMDPTTGELLGNIPQTLSHLALIGAATALVREQPLVTTTQTSRRGSR
ncbi:MAG TPA: glycoside hydrolase family 15 protein [Nocardioidaceae bacterium]|nr:glycoside hydrolase family 15 protein [Nocardioidaceae bacterium]